MTAPAFWQRAAMLQLDWVRMQDVIVSSEANRPSLETIWRHEMLETGSEERAAVAVAAAANAIQQATGKWPVMPAALERRNQQWNQQQPSPTQPRP